jgi:pimeloyl-ACP methyl ester carboxylesterase
VGWDRGVDADYLAELVAYWATAYDWREHETRIRALPWMSAGPLRVIHQRAAERDAPVVVLLHGWPDSVLRFGRLLPLLTDVHVVVPALPGFPFAAPLSRPGTSVAVMAAMVAEAMADLGYERYAVSAGDFGVHVAEHLAVAHRERVRAMHLTNLAPRYAASVDPADVTPPERTYLADLERWRAVEGGYLAEQTTRPHTLAVGLGDSPAGLAAWIVEKLRAWSDCEGDLESVFPRDELLTWITAYWMAATIGTSFGPYIEPTRQPGRIVVPAFLSVFRHDMTRAPRASPSVSSTLWVGTSMPPAATSAWERPHDYAADLQRVLRYDAIADPDVASLV